MTLAFAKKEAARRSEILRKTYFVYRSNVDGDEYIVTPELFQGFKLICAFYRGVSS